MSIWRKIRIVVLALFFAQGLLCTSSDFEAISESIPLALGMGLVIVPIVLIPLGLLLVIGVQYINPFQDKQWTAPSMDSNFLNFKNPVHFFHAGGYFFAAAGLGMIVGAFYQGASNVIFGFGLLSGSIGLLLGVKLCVKVYRKKFAEERRSDCLLYTSDAVDE